MSPYLAIPIVYAVPDPALSMDCPAILEQPDHMQGYVRKADLIKALENNLFNANHALDINCLLNVAGAYQSMLNMNRLSSMNLGAMGITNGVTEEETVQESEITESIKFSLTSKQSTQYPVQAILSRAWQGECWDRDGATVSPPVITIDGQNIILSEPVYGTVTITYRTVKRSRKITVPPRGGVTAGAYDSVAWVIKDCGVELLVLNPPPNAADNFQSDKNCWGSYLLPSEKDDPEPDKIPRASEQDIEINIDYCTQYLMTDSYYD